MTTSKEMRDRRQERLFLNFRIDQVLLERIERVHEQEQKRTLYPLHRSSVLIKLLELGLRTSEKGGKA